MVFRPPRCPDARFASPRSRPTFSRIRHLPPAAPVTCLYADSTKRSRIATWNIRAARSASLDAIAAELQHMQADVIALQEVDVRMRRTGFVDEPAALASALGFHYVFAASIKWDEGDYGLAVLSRWPLTEVRRHRLDAATAAEPRIVLEATICAGGRRLRVFNHHADGRVASRHAGFEELRGIVQAVVGHGVLVLGDFNEHADAAGVSGLIDAGLVDLGAERNVETAGQRPHRLPAGRRSAGSSDVQRSRVAHRPERPPRSAGQSQLVKW